MTDGVNFVNEKKEVMTGNFGVKEIVGKMLPSPQNSLYNVDVTAYLGRRVF
jgi:hypothetical protein